MKAIVAMAANRVIGNKRDLPWPKNKDDLRWFKEFTLNKIIVAGTRTGESLPPLPGRKLIILSRKYNVRRTENSPNWCYYTLPQIIALDKRYFGELICIGGAITYQLFLPYITEFYVTHIKAEYDGDIYMSEFESRFNSKELIKSFGHSDVIRYYNV